MKIEVQQYKWSYPVELNEDGEFRCPHYNAVVEPPCCSGLDCGCYGMHSVYCYDCHNDDITEHEVELLIENYKTRDEEF